MALVTVQRSPSSNNSPTTQQDEKTGLQDEVDTNRNPKSLSECYFAGKGTASVLPDAEAPKSSSSRRSGTQGGSNIQKHLQSMFYLLRQEETLKMAVKLESVHPSRTRYLVVVSRMGARSEESCLLGIDCNEQTTVGLVLKVLADTQITLDGDGGFSVSVCDRHHIFKPVSVQAMWSALQTLHKVSAKAREQTYFQGGVNHAWVSYYENRIESEQSCLNEWHAMDNLESKRPPSPDSIRTKPTEREETEKVIRTTLKEIMMSVDLDEVTSKVIRSRLEEELNMDLGEYKSFIDQEILVILGQMDAPTEIFEHVYLGSEWNASNHDELKKNGVGHILNVTREIDNFFPGKFDYLNIRVYDDEKTDLLKHWDDTFKYITKAKDTGSKVLVHCKMGVSRSASVVIAYAMKAYNWDFTTALKHVKEKRSCIKPNTSFLSQLETYQGILDAMKNKEKLQRSKSETNLKSPGNSGKSEKVLVGSEPTPVVQALSKSYDLQATMSGQDLRQLGGRPKSWSPDNLPASDLLSSKCSPVFLSLEDLSQKSSSKESVQTASDVISSLARHVLIPCDNGESYSVSPNQIVHLPGQYNENNDEEGKHKKKLVLNLTTKFESEACDDSSCNNFNNNNNNGERKPVKEAGLRPVVVKTETWDPGEAPNDVVPTSDTPSCDSVSVSQTVWTSSTVLKTQSAVPSSNNFISKVPESPQTRSKLRKDSDPFSNQLDRVFDREEKKQQKNLSEDKPVVRDCPSRQSSWSSYDSAVIMGGYQHESNDVLSRHSSWGSGDTRTLPSRNSSWGSYDMRPRGSVYYLNEKGEKILHTNTELTSSSSCRIFPYEDIPCNPGTVRRTKQKIEETGSLKKDQSPSSETLLFDLVEDKPTEVTVEAVVDAAEDHSSSAISDKIDIPSDESKTNNSAAGLSRLSISAPEPSSMELVTQECALSRSASNVSNSSSVISTAQCSSVKQHRTYLENLHKDTQHMTKKIDDLLDNSSSSSGIVRNLKKEFEAKSSTNLEPTIKISLCSNDVNKTRSNSSSNNRITSLPSSPVSQHQDKDKNNRATSDDLNLKNLIGIFENNHHEVSLRQKNHTNKPFRNARYSCIEVSVEKSPVRITQTPLISNLNKNKVAEGEFKRPPIMPVVRNASQDLIVAATVIAKAAKKQQQYGSSHPLAKLNVKPRHNSAVYNTM